MEEASERTPFICEQNRLVRLKRTKSGCIVFSMFANCVCWAVWSFSDGCLLTKAVWLVCHTGSCVPVTGNRKMCRLEFVTSVNERRKAGLLTYSVSSKRRA